jgi:hypothetical protein
MLNNQKSKAEPTRQNRGLYDVLDLKLALMELNKRGFDLEFSFVDARTEHMICKRTGNRFVIECLGHNEWPVHSD